MNPSAVIEVRNLTIEMKRAAHERLEALGVKVPGSCDLKRLAGAVARWERVPEPGSRDTRVALIEHFIKAGSKASSLPPLQPLKPESMAMRDALARTREARQIPSWYDKQRGMA